LHDPTEDELERVAKDFALHPLAVEDAVKAHQRPKVEEFEDSLFVVLKTVRYDEGSQQIELGDVMLFLGDSFIVSVRHGQVSRAL
jgi:magnesium transporter